MVFEIGVVSEYLVSDMLSDLLVYAGKAFLWWSGEFIPLFGLFLFLELLDSFNGFLACDRLRPWIFADSTEDIIFVIIGPIPVSSFLLLILIFNLNHFVVLPLIALSFQIFDLILQIEQNFFDVFVVHVILDLLGFPFLEKVQKLVDLQFFCLLCLLLGLGPCWFGFLLVRIGCLFLLLLTWGKGFWLFLWGLWVFVWCWGVVVDAESGRRVCYLFHLLSSLLSQFLQIFLFLLLLILLFAFLFFKLFFKLLKPFFVVIKHWQVSLLCSMLPILFCRH